MASRIELLRDAGKDLWEAAAPPCFQIYVGAHSTGCQAQITLKEEGLDPLLIWQGSIWYSQSYEFNDAKKVLGVQPGCEFAAPMLDAFFANLQQRHAAVIAEREAATAAKDAAATQHQSALTAAYRERFTAQAEGR